VHYKETVGIDGLVCILRRPEPDRNAAPEPEFVRDLTSGNIGKYLESIETLIEDVKGMFSRYGLD
jgi:hypothetical protein